MRVNGPRLRHAAGAVSLGAGGIHGMITPAHFQEWVGYGFFFVAATTAQILFGLALLTGAVNPKDWGTNWETVLRRLYMWGMLGNASIILVYVVSRTVGVPYLGPEPWQPQPVQAIDIASKVLELTLIGLLAVLWTHARGTGGREGQNAFTGG